MVLQSVWKNFTAYTDARTILGFWLIIWYLKALGALQKGVGEQGLVHVHLLHIPEPACVLRVVVY